MAGILKTAREGGTEREGGDREREREREKRLGPGVSE
jgi:hypothetical protein